MGKIQECSKCANFTEWSLPRSVRAENYAYAKQCLETAKTTFVCGQTMKTKGIGHKQQCKYFIPEMECQEKAQECYRKEIEELEQKIKDYEQLTATGQDKNEEKQTAEI